MTWLNGQCQMYAWCLPLGWRERCGRARTYGPLEVWLLDRRDFIAAKIVSSPQRPHDIEDVIAVKPTEAEFVFVENHLDRLTEESLDTDRTFEDARAILQSLRGNA